MTHKTKEKFQPKWEGPFVVESVYSNRSYHLITPEGNTLMMSIDGRFLKKYYPDPSYDQINTAPLIKTLRSKMFGRASKKSFFLQRPHHGRSTPSRSNNVDIMMHDVNIEERIKAKCQVLALLLFSSLSTLPLMSPTAKG